jgi:Putative peptidoglycan binding domain/N-acetylmuramoyl-L-alanine amidase
MAVTRAWWPSQHYSGGGLSPRVIAFHTTEGSSTAESLRNWLTNPSSKVSYHFAVDMSHGDNWCANFVRTSDRAWAQANFNGAAVSIAFCTPSGAASGWSRDTWLSKGVMLTAAGRLAGELSRQFNIPRTQLSSSQAQGSGRGFCEHKNFGAGGGNHHDCGNGFPMDRILAIAGGAQAGPAPSPPSGGGAAPPLRVDYFGRSHNSSCPDVRVWQDKMRSRGWSIGVDGQFGPQSEDVCKKFQREKGLGADGLVGPQTWNATWSAPVT